MDIQQKLENQVDELKSTRNISADSVLLFVFTKRTVFTTTNNTNILKHESYLCRKVLDKWNFVKL